MARKPIERYTQTPKLGREPLIPEKLANVRFVACSTAGVRVGRHPKPSLAAAASNGAPRKSLVGVRRTLSGMSLGLLILYPALAK